MCRYIQGNHCSLKEKCHCHPQPDKDTYDDKYVDTFKAFFQVSIDIEAQGQLLEQG